MVVWSWGLSVWVFGSYRCLLVPYAVIPAWLAHLFVPIWGQKSSCFIPSVSFVHRYSEILDNHRNTTTRVTLTWSPITHCPALIFSSSKCRVCLSAYFTPISILVSIPLVFAWKTDGASQRSDGPEPSFRLRDTHHAGQSEQSGLYLGHVPVFKQVVGLKDVTGLKAIRQDCFDEISKVFQLQSNRWNTTWGNGDAAGHQEKDWEAVFTLTLCQFSCEWLIFFTKPGCSLLMSLRETDRENNVNLNRYTHLVLAYNT